MTPQLIIHIFLITIVPALLAFQLEKNQVRTLGRRPYFLRILCLFALSLLYGILFGQFFGPTLQPWINTAVTALINGAIFMFGFQRIRDCGIQTRYYGLFLIPILNLLFVLSLLFIPKKKAPNTDYNA